MEKILAVIVNYGEEQLQYLQQVITSLKSFKKYDVTIIVHSNIALPSIEGIDKVNIFELEDFQLLPLTCRKTIKQNYDYYDYFIYSENDHLWLEHHIDKFKEYTNIIPENRIVGLLQYEQNGTCRHYPALHAKFKWDWDSVEEYGGKKFAHFNNVHQASFLINKKQLSVLMSKYNFEDFFTKKNKTYSKKCRVNTDIYQYSGWKKIICISEFEQNLIHHLPNIYINGFAGEKTKTGKVVKIKRYKLGSRETEMQNAIQRLLSGKKLNWFRRFLTQFQGK